MEKKRSPSQEPEVDIKKVKKIEEFDFDYWHDNKTSKPEYIKEDGLIRIKPYFYIYECNAKGRWINKSIYSVFSKEFQDQPSEYYKSAVEKGRIRVNQKVVNLEYKIKNQDLIQHLIHRHEPPLCNSKSIEIIDESKDLIVVNKPASMPVHPSGRYNYNTLLSILKYENDYKNLFPVNRLDRLTSGIVLLARNSNKAKEMEGMMKDNKVYKKYLCRVEGKFPEGIIECDQPIKTLDFKLGLNMVDPNGKPSSTKFEFISFNGTTSLIRAYPKTGRTHQIRVHLLYLGYPIANDPLYFKKDNNNEKITLDNLDEIKIDLLERSKIRISNKLKDEPGWSNCSTCDNLIPPDPKMKDSYIYLHAYSYRSDEWEFETKVLPGWANDDYFD